MSKASAKALSASDGIALEKITQDKPLLVKANGEDALIFKDGRRYYAIAAKCTHMGGPLAEGLLRDGTIRCPWHHARFCIKTGEAVAAPALKALPCFKTTVRDKKLFLQRLEQPRALIRRGPARNRIVIVGAGAGGFACADMLVRSGFAGTLTVVNSDPAGSYDRTTCSKDYLAGKIKRAECFLSSETHLKSGRTLRSRRVTWLNGRTVTVLDVKKRAVHLDSGERVDFDYCVLATGAEPQRPTLPPWNHRSVFVLRSLADADAIIERAGRSKSAVILGASFIALEAAASLRQRHLQVHVVAPIKTPFEKQFGTDVGALIKRLHEDKGVRFHLERRLVSYRSKRVRLDDGSDFKADFVILGTGVSPRLELARAAGLRLAGVNRGDGVLVDQHLRTSERAIYAIGDIASYPSTPAGPNIRVEHWVHAQRQGQYVARALMGHRGLFEDVPFFWSAHYDQTLSYVGHAQKLMRSQLRGRLGAKKFALKFFDAAGGKALLTSQRDLESLRAEANWSSVRRSKTRK